MFPHSCSGASPPRRRAPAIVDGNRAPRAADHPAALVADNSVLRGIVNPLLDARMDVDPQRVLDSVRYGEELGSAERASAARPGD